LIYLRAQANQLEMEMYGNINSITEATTGWSVSGRFYYLLIVLMNVLIDHPVAAEKIYY